MSSIVCNIPSPGTSIVWTSIYHVSGGDILRTLQCSGLGGSDGEDNRNCQLSVIISLFFFFLSKGDYVIKHLEFQVKIQRCTVTIVICLPLEMIFLKDLLSLHLTFLNCRFFILLNISLPVAYIFLIFYIYIHIDDMY